MKTSLEVPMNVFKNRMLNSPIPLPQARIELNTEQLDALAISYSRSVVKGQMSLPEAMRQWYATFLLTAERL